MYFRKCVGWREIVEMMSKKMREKLYWTCNPKMHKNPFQNLTKQQIILLQNIVKFKHTSLLKNQSTPPLSKHIVNIQDTIDPIGLNWHQSMSISFNWWPIVSIQHQLVSIDVNWDQLMSNWLNYTQLTSIGHQLVSIDDNWD